MQQYRHLLDRVIINGDRIYYHDGIVRMLIDDNVVCYDFNNNTLTINDQEFDFEDNSVSLLGRDHEFFVLIDAIDEALSIASSKKVSFIIRKMNILRYGHAYYQACSVLGIPSSVKADWFIAATISIQ